MRRLFSLIIRCSCNSHLDVTVFVIVKERAERVCATLTFTRFFFSFTILLIQLIHAYDIEDCRTA
jgi:hypothetical protein